MHSNEKNQKLVCLYCKACYSFTAFFFELDEICTYAGNKQNRYWVVYALCSETKKIIDFILGRRTKRMQFISGIKIVSDSNAEQKDNWSLLKLLVLIWCL